MITGRYDPTQFELLLPLTLTAPRTGFAVTVDVVVDTGCTGYLFLLREVADTLGLHAEEARRVEWANGAVEEVPVCRVVVDWEGRRRLVPAHLVSAERSLIGVKMLHGSLLTAEFLSSGSVIVEAIA